MNDVGLPVKKDVGLQIDRNEMGKADTLRFNINTYVVNENYERAIKELGEFLEKPSEYPQFHDRIERYISHSVDLINAIKAKRRFPGINNLTMAKQQELSDKFREHFSELQYVLKKIEKIQVDLRISDVRSTVWILKSFWWSAFLVLGLGFVLELHGGLLTTAIVVLEDTLSTITRGFLGF